MSAGWVRWFSWAVPTYSLIVVFSVVAYLVGLNLPWWGSVLVGVAASLIGGEVEGPIAKWWIARRERKGEGSS